MIVKKYYYSSGELSDIIKFDEEYNRVVHTWKDKKGREVDVLNNGKKVVKLDKNRFGFMPIDVYCGEMTCNYTIFRNIKELTDGIVCLFKNITMSEHKGNLDEFVEYSNNEVEKFLDKIDNINDSLPLEEKINILNNLKLGLDEGYIFVTPRKCQIIELNKEFDNEINNISDKYIIRKPSESEIKNKDGCTNGIYEIDQPDSYVMKYYGDTYLRLSFGKIACGECSYYSSFN